MSFLEQINNPKGYYIKKYLSEIIPNSYNQHNDIAQRIGQAIVTESDLEKFAKLLADLFQSGYLRAVEDHKKQLEKLNLKAHIHA